MEGRHLMVTYTLRALFASVVILVLAGCGLPALAVHNPPQKRRRRKPLPRQLPLRPIPCFNCPMSPLAFHKSRPISGTHYPPSISSRHGGERPTEHC